MLVLSPLTTDDLALWKESGAAAHLWLLLHCGSIPTQMKYTNLKMCPYLVSNSPSTITIAFIFIYILYTKQS